MRWLVAYLITSTSGFTTPAYCNRSFLEVTEAKPVEAKRYAVVLNRHCYRGFSGIDYRNKDSYVGTQRAVDMQLALINSVLGNVVLPLEHLGFDVDVFLVAHDPAPLYKIRRALGSVDPSLRRPRRRHEAITWIGPRRRPRFRTRHGYGRDVPAA